MKSLPWSCLNKERTGNCRQVTQSFHRQTLIHSESRLYCLFTHFQLIIVDQSDKTHQVNYDFTFSAL